MNRQSRDRLRGTSAIRGPWEGIAAFILWTFQRENPSLGRFANEGATAVEYLKNLAVSRLYLENILNAQSSRVTRA